MAWTIESKVFSFYKKQEFYNKILNRGVIFFTTPGILQKRMCFVYFSTFPFFF